MIPVSLTIGGIYSYREKQTIDFQPLTNAGIFGIFGSVGSGKSTILEAISFALYGETERLNKRDDRAYNMMNLKSKELFIDFIFKTGADEQEYRFLVKGKRNNKNFEKVATLDRSAYKKVNEAWEPVEVEAIASILQLSYENFRRTIIIPQGKFQEFLELTDTERTRMMKELFHLQRFELYDNISVLEQKNNEQRIRLEERIQQTGLITAEEIAAKENESLLLQQQLKSNQLLIAEKKAAEQLFLQLKKLFVRIAEQKALLLSLQLQQPGMKLLEQRIKSYEYCLLHFKPLFDRRTELQKQQDDQVAMLSLQTKELQQIEKTLTEKEKQFPEIKNVFENRQQLKARSEELQKIIQLNELHAALQKVNLRLENGNIFLQTTDAELLTLQQQKDSISIQVKELKESLPDVLLLSEIKSWFIHKNSFATTVQNTINEQQSISMKTNALSADKNALFTPVIKKILPGIIIDETSGELIGQIKIRLNEIAETLHSNENELQHLLLQQQLEEYATQIKPGEPCPLCGAIEHPQILSATEVKVSIKKLNLEKEIAQKNIALLQKIIQELEIIRSREASTAEQLAALQQRLKKEKSLLKKHDDKFIWTSWQKEDEQELNKQFSLADQQKKSIAKAEAAFEKIEKQRKEKETQKETGRTTLENLKNESSALQAQVSLLQQQFKLLNADEYTEAETKNINQEILQLKNAYDKAEENFRSLELQLQQLRKITGELTGSITTGKSNLETLTRLLKETADNLFDLEKNSGIDILTATTLLASQLNVPASRNSLQQFQLKLHTATQLLEESEKDTAGKTYDATLHDQLLQELSACSSLIEQQQQQSATLSASINQAKQQVEQRILLTQELNAVQLRGEDISTLKNLFKASGFVNYVSSVHLQQLCNAANDRFYKLTRQQLRLEVSESNNFLVRDFMNNGQLRSVKTLSGGQKFQAALSLALALADSIQIHSQSKQNFFFLDEGFGSLDSDSLDMVFETLRSLRKENRIVGIISHVKEMQQEIDTCLTIVNDEEKGSEIVANW